MLYDAEADAILPQVSESVGREGEVGMVPRFRLHWGFDRGDWRGVRFEYMTVSEGRRLVGLCVIREALEMVGWPLIASEGDERAPEKSVAGTSPTGALREV